MASLVEMQGVRDGEVKQSEDETSDEEDPPHLASPADGGRPLVGSMSGLVAVHPVPQSSIRSMGLTASSSVPESLVYPDHGEEPSNQAWTVRRADGTEMTGLPVDCYQTALFFATCDEVHQSSMIRTIRAGASQLRRGLEDRRARVLQSLSRRGASRRDDDDDDDAGETKFGRQTTSGSCETLSEVYARYRMLGGVTVLLVLQVTLMHQLLFSVEHRSCSSSRDCVRGTSCSLWRHAGGETNVCTACEPLASGNETRRIEASCFGIFDDEALLRRYDRNEVPSPQVRFAGTEDRYTGFGPRVYVEFCAGCIDDDGTYTTLRAVTRRTSRAMRLGDYCTLLVCGAAVALTIVAELKDIKVATMAQKLSFRRTQHHARAHAWFATLNNTRQYLLISQIVASVPRLVLLEGSDTVSLIFNTVSIIFVTELDNLMTNRLISVPTRRRLTKVATVFAADKDHRYLGVIQKTWSVGVLLLIFIGLFAEVWSSFPGISFLLALAGAYLAGFVEILAFADQPHLTRILFCANIAYLDTIASHLQAFCTRKPSTGTCYFARFPRHRHSRRRHLVSGHPLIITLDLAFYSIEFLVAVAVPLIVLNFLTGAIFRSFLS